MGLTLPTPFSALIFDCDGTLVDTAPAHYNAISRALSLQGHSMDRSWYMARTGLTPDALLDAHEAAHHTAHAASHPAPPAAPPRAPLPLDRTAVFARYNQLYKESLHLLQEVSLVASLARYWYGRVPMAVASNGRRSNVIASLNATGLLPLFQHIVAAEDVPRGKPSPDVFLEAARRLAYSPAACVVIEDSNEGLAAASAAGMRSLDVRPALNLSHHPA